MLQLVEALLLPGSHGQGGWCPGGTCRVVGRCPGGTCRVVGRCPGGTCRVAVAGRGGGRCSPEMTSRRSMSLSPSRKSSSMFSICVPAFRRWELHQAVKVWGGRTEGGREGQCGCWGSPARRPGCGPDSASTRPPWGPRRGSGPGHNLYLHWRPSPQRPRQADGRKLRLRLVPRPQLGQRDNEWQSVDWNSRQQPKS